jgi:hypothetical protein
MADAEVSLATFVCVFFLEPALLSGGLASIGPADGEAAMQDGARYGRFLKTPVSIAYADQADS